VRQLQAGAHPHHLQLQTEGQAAAHPHHLQLQAVMLMLRTYGAGALLRWPLCAAGFVQLCCAAYWRQTVHAAVPPLLQARGLAVGFAACAARTAAASWERQPLPLLLLLLLLLLQGPVVTGALQAWMAVGKRHSRQAGMQADRQAGRFSPQYV
jgi:hypothetical protein